MTTHKLMESKVQSESEEVLNPTVYKNHSTRQQTACYKYEYTSNLLFLKLYLKSNPPKKSYIVIHHRLRWIIESIFRFFFAVIHEDQPFFGAWAAENTTGFGRWRGWRPGQRLWGSFRGRGPVESRWPPHDFVGKQWKKHMCLACL